MTRMLGASCDWRRCQCWDCRDPLSWRTPKKRARRKRERHQWVSEARREMMSA